MGKPDSDTYALGLATAQQVSRSNPGDPSLNMQFPRSDGPFDAITPIDELGAYEALWATGKVSFRKISKAVHATGEPLLTSLVSRADVETHADLALALLATKGVKDFGIHVRSD